MTSYFAVFFCNPTCSANTDIHDRTDEIGWNQALSIVYLFAMVISLSPSRVPSFLLVSSHVFCPTSAPSAPSAHSPPLVISPSCRLISLSSINPTQCSPATIAPLIEISAQQAEAQREMLFWGNFRGAGLCCRFLSSKLSCQWDWVSDQADIVRM